MDDVNLAKEFLRQGWARMAFAFHLVAQGDNSAILPEPSADVRVEGSFYLYFNEGERVCVKGDEIPALFGFADAAEFSAWFVEALLAEEKRKAGG